MKKIAVISDPHCGSTAGLCPRKHSFIEGGVYVPNKGQLWLLRCWEKSIRWLLKKVAGEQWGLVLNGDMVEGRHHGTVQLITSDFQEHLMIAQEMLMPVVEKADRVWLVRGTECHAKTVESVLGNYLGAERDPVTGDSCFEQLQLRVNGVLTHFKHHVSVALRPWSKGGPAMRAFRIEQARACDLGHETPRVIVRSHAHEYDYWEGAPGCCLITPAWQLMTRFARKVTQASLASPGLCLLDYDDLSPTGLPRIDVHLHHPDADPVLDV